MNNMIKKHSIILLFAIWNNIGNLGYFAYQIWFNWLHIDYPMDWSLYFRLQFMNHILILFFALGLFYVRELIRNK